MRSATFFFLLFLPALGQTPQDEAALERLLKVTEKLYRETADPSDLYAVARKLGNDRKRVFEFVRDKIAFEPYSGVLRGPRGTLLARSGNAIDQSILLIYMLRAGGDKVRIVRKQIPEEAAAELREKFLKQDPLARIADRRKRGQYVAKELGADEKAMASLVRENRRREENLVNEVLDASQVEAARLHKMVKGNLKPAAELKVGRDHFWVQVWDTAKNGWVDLDPCGIDFPRDGAVHFTTKELPTVRRFVTFRLTLTRSAAGKKETVQLLNVVFPADRLAWKSIDFMLEPAEGELPDAEKLSKMKPKEKLAALAKVKKFRPGLIVDGKPYGALPFDLDGKTYKVHGDARIGAAMEMGATLKGVFERGLGGLLGGNKKKKPKVKLVNVIFQLIVKDPGVPARTHERVILHGKDAGKVGRLPMLRWSFLFDPHFLPDGESARRDLGVLVTNLGPIRAVLSGKYKGVHVKEHSEVRSLLMRFSDMRRHVLLRILSWHKGELTFTRDRTGIIVEKWELFRRDDTLTLRRSIDLFDNSLTFVTTKGIIDQGAALGMGVADTALESLILTATEPTASVPSAWVLMERARIVNKAGSVVAKGNKIVVSWDKDAFWEVDPATGVCVGRVPSGSGQAMIEYAYSTADKICDWIGDIATLASTMKGDAADAAGVVSDICSVVKGTIVRDKVRDKIIKMTKGLWKQATAAIAGLPIE